MPIDLSAWQTLPLEACMAAIIDYRGKTPKKTSFGVPLVTAKIVKGGRIETPTEFIAPGDYDAWMRRGLPQAGDVLITTEAPLGEVAQLDDRKVALAQRLICLRADPSLLENRFLNYLLQSSEVQQELRARATGTTVLGIKQSELRRVALCFPPLGEQRAIAQVLGALDDKIELNRRMNETLEEMARALFQSWFVDFDPVRAKMEGRQPYGMDAATASLFPDCFEESDLGPIPRGWQAGVLGDVAESPRRTIKPEAIPADTPYFGLEHMPRGSIALTDWGKAEKVTSGKFQFEEGEILFGKLRPYFHKVGVAPVSGVCSTDILVVIPKARPFFSFVLGHASSSALIEHANATSTGTRMPRTKWKDLALFGVALPPTEIVERYGDVVGPLLAKIKQSIHESHTLEATRDALLPKLLSGEIRIGEAERQVEAVV